MPASDATTATVLMLIVSAAACDFDFDAFDPRLGQAQAGGEGGTGGEGVAGTGGQAGASATAGTAGSGQGGTTTTSSAGGAAGTAGAGGAPGCVEMYGDYPGFLLCEETATTCAFNADHGAGVSCGDVCQQEGGVCLEVYINGRPNLCEKGELITCSSNVSYNDICVCTL